MGEFTEAASGRVMVQRHLKSSSPSFWVVVREFCSELSAWVVLAGITFYYYLTLLTFSADDPSYYTALAPAPAQVANGGGEFGAELSAHLLTWLGLGAYVVPLWWLFLTVYYRLKGWPRSSIFRLFMVLAQGTLGVILVVLFCFLSSLFAGRGGWLGVMVGEAGERHFGVLGSWVLWVCLASAMVLGKVNFSWARLLRFAGWLRGGMGAPAMMQSSRGAHWSTQAYLVVAYLRRFGQWCSGFVAAFLPERAATGLSSSAQQDPLALDSTQQRRGSASGFHENSAGKTAPAHLERRYRGFFRRKKAGSDAEAALKNQRAGRAAQQVLAQTLEDFNVVGSMLGYQTGPRVRTFEFEPASGVKQTKLISLADDIARALKVESVIIQPIPGKSSMGVQVPRSDASMVYLGDILSPQQKLSEVLPLGIGMNPAGQPVLMDLAQMPHLLMAGATGSGKSVGIHALINSLICGRSPAEVRMILVDPKMLELSVYSGLPHLAAPVITDVQQACVMLEWAVQEMECRYRLMQDLGVRHIGELHQRWRGLSRQQREQEREMYPGGDILPYLVIVIDELADLMLMAPKEVEAFIQRLSQKARASGIHLVLATQRPSVDVITGVIKANFPARIAFQVVSKHDSRTILDQVGAEKLLGKGDMLFQSPLKLKPERLQGAYVSESEIRSLLGQLCSDYEPHYIAALAQKLEHQQKDEELSSTQSDPKWPDALKIAQAKGNISASYLQRRLQIGYNRAARIIEAMEAAGLIAAASGVKPRRWLGKIDEGL